MRSKVGLVVVMVIYTIVLFAMVVEYRTGLMVSGMASGGAGALSGWVVVGVLLWGVVGGLVGKICGDARGDAERGVALGVLLGPIGWLVILAQGKRVDERLRDWEPGE